MTDDEARLARLTAGNFTAEELAQLGEIITEGQVTEAMEQIDGLFCVVLYHANDTPADVGVVGPFISSIDAMSFLNTQVDAARKAATAHPLAASYAEKYGVLCGFVTPLCRD